MSRVPVIAGNWKMNRNLSESVDLARELVGLVGQEERVEVVVAPAFTALHAVGEALGGSKIGLAAQNVHWEASGAYTGEVSTAMLASVGCRYVIIGHSERRQFFGDTDEVVNSKLKAVVAAELVPILCVGETLDEREGGKTMSCVATQLEQGMAGLTREELEGLIVAYEPVWAIGTGKTASPDQAQEVHAFIRERLGISFGSGFALATRLQYGGSVKPGNVNQLMAQKDVDGALVGGAALSADSFAGIVRFEN